MDNKQKYLLLYYQLLPLNEKSIVLKGNYKATTQFDNAAGLTFVTIQNEQPELIGDNSVAASMNVRLHCTTQLPTKADEKTNIISINDIRLQSMAKCSIDQDVSQSVSVRPQNTYNIVHIIPGKTFDEEFFSFAQTQNSTRAEDLLIYNNSINTSNTVIPIYSLNATVCIDGDINADIQDNFQFKRSFTAINLANQEGSNKAKFSFVIKRDGNASNLELFNSNSKTKDSFKILRKTKAKNLERKGLFLKDKNVRTLLGRRRTRAQDITRKGLSLTDSYAYYLKRFDKAIDLSRENLVPKSNDSYTYKLHRKNFAVNVDRENLVPESNDTYTFKIKRKSLALNCTRHSFPSSIKDTYNFYTRRSAKLLDIRQVDFLKFFDTTSNFQIKKDYSGTNIEPRYLDANLESPKLKVQKDFDATLVMPGEISTTNLKESLGFTSLGLRLALVSPKTNEASLQNTAQIVKKANAQLIAEEDLKDSFENNVQVQKNYRIADVYKSDNQNNLINSINSTLSLGATLVSDNCADLASKACTQFLNSYFLTILDFSIVTVDCTYNGESSLEFAANAQAKLIYENEQSSKQDMSLHTTGVRRLQLISNQEQKENLKSDLNFLNNYNLYIASWKDCSSILDSKTQFINNCRLHTVSQQDYKQDSSLVLNFSNNCLLYIAEQKDYSEALSSSINFINDANCVCIYPQTSIVNVQNSLTFVNDIEVEVEQTEPSDWIDPVQIDDTLKIYQVYSYDANDGVLKLDIDWIDPVQSDYALKIKQIYDYSATESATAIR